MENLLESNERTLVMFDAVCAGLSTCLALVHSDIKHMTEHRNKLTQLQHEHIQAKLSESDDMAADCASLDAKSRRKKKAAAADSAAANNRIDVNANDDVKAAHGDNDDDDDDPHHLSKLKLLDKRLADSFSHALSMNDLQKSSIHAKHLANHSRPSIFQVLLGKSAKAQQADKKLSGSIDKNSMRDQRDTKVDNKTLIDDINRQTRLAMQYLKQLDAHLLKVEDLRTKYELHLKMGLVVKSVARAYVGSANDSANMLNTIAGPKLHRSSLVINDSSSLGTHSSMSSLNLSTWSSSRSRARKRQEAINNYNNNNNNTNLNNNAYVSTISLNNTKSPRHLSLARMISSATARSRPASQQHCFDQQQAVKNGLSLRVSSQSNDYPPCMNNNCNNYTEWAAPETVSGGQLYDNQATLNKSNVNLHASHSSLKRSRSKSQQASKTTIKEFIDNIDKIEAEFELYMGSFLLAVEDIQGFARVCQGDVFEITIKYGDSQKFKTKISVLKDNRQKCDNRQIVFKSRVADILAIKAYECKGLGKRVLLGHKLCETRDLFTARSQLMTISLNKTGSIKLNLIVTWNPLHMAPNSASAIPGLDISHISLPPTPVSSSTLSSTSSTAPSINGTMTTININSSHHHLNQQQHQRHHQHHRRPTNELVPNSAADDYHQHNDSIYQTVDPTYGYYIPPPDYLTNEVK